MHPHVTSRVAIVALPETVYTVDDAAMLLFSTKTKTMLIKCPVVSQLGAQKWKLKVYQMYTVYQLKFWC